VRAYDPPMKKGVTALVWLVLVLPNPVFACSVCGCGDPLAAAGEAAPMASQLTVRLDAEQLSASARSDDDPTVTEGLTQRSLVPALVWSPLDAVSLVAEVPLVEKDWKAKADDGTVVDAVDSRGLGDAQVGARWFALRQTDLAARTSRSIAVTAGATLPTGPDNAKDDAGERIDQHAQLGTGAFGPSAGIQAAFRGEVWGRAANVVVVTHTANSERYRFGSAVRWSFQGEYTPDERWLLTLGCDGRYADHDTADGATQLNTGGTVVAAAPSVWFRVAPGTWLRAEAQVPVWTHLFGDQHLGTTLAMACQYTLGAR